MKGYLACAAYLCLIFVTSVAPMRLPHRVCEVSPNTQEIRDHFSIIRSVVQSEDKHMDLRIMEQFCLQEIPLSDRCCFLHRMLHFYMGKVLNRYISQNLKHNKSIRDIGNSFYSLSEELNPCHSRKMCSCQDQTSAKLETIEDNFNKLDHTSAAGKALGELDILLDWMEKQY